MSNRSIVIGFSSTKQTHLRCVPRPLAKLQAQYLIEMEWDAVVVTRDAKGKVQLHQAINLTAAGAASGGFWGMLGIGNAVSQPAGRRGDRREQGARPFRQKAYGYRDQ